MVLSFGTGSDIHTPKKSRLSAPPEWKEGVGTMNKDGNFSRGFFMGSDQHGKHNRMCRAKSICQVRWSAFTFFRESIASNVPNHAPFGHIGVLIDQALAHLPRAGRCSDV